MSKLNDFKVEELEQRLEMGRWSLAGGRTADGSDSLTHDSLWLGAKYTARF